MRIYADALSFRPDWDDMYARWNGIGWAVYSPRLACDVFVVSNRDLADEIIARRGDVPFEVLQSEDGDT